MHLPLCAPQGFRTAEEVERYDAMMQELCSLVAEKHGGSLKAEHGTGRNVAPWVEMEWGTKAFELMWELKELFDPNYVLNPGVILNGDPDIHKKSLKPSPPASSIVDRCIECGFCESNCPSRDVTLTPRQRITVYREISRLKALPSRTAVEELRLKEFREAFDYLGQSTCAADGMCQTKCPVKINTGELIKAVRAEEMAADGAATGVSKALASNFSMTVTAAKTALRAADIAHAIFGPGLLETVSGKLNEVTGRAIPVWNKYLPRAAGPLPEPLPAQPMVGGLERKVVYVPSCVTRMMGPARGDSTDEDVTEKMMSILGKAGYEVVYPEGVSSLCCGMMFNSRGAKAAAQGKSDELEQALLKASENGKYPILIDTSPCLQSIKESFTSGKLRFGLYEPVEFISTFLMDKLEFEPARKSVAVHVPCSSKKMGLEDTFMKVASKCADEVHSSGIPCCGMAGDRGMRYPELTGSSLQHLAVPSGCTDGYSSSRTCEMSLSNHSGINFRGLVYLVDEATRAKGKQPQQ